MPRISAVLRSVAVGHLERLFDDDALDLFHRLAERNRDTAFPDCGVCATAEELVGETLDGQACSPRAMMNARLITLRSSRTLPGHS